MAFVAAVAVAGMAVVTAQAQEKPKVQVQIPDPGVPQAMTMEGKFVRAAYNNEGYVIIGYQVANRSIGEEYMMIDLGHHRPRQRAGLQAHTRQDRGDTPRRQEHSAADHGGVSQRST